MFGGSEFPEVEAILMVYTRDFIKVFGLALGVTLLKLGNGNEHCDHPWRQDFGLRINDSIEESFKSLSNILERFFKNTASDSI
uniref:Uncharacterized protein n=1 Tax=Magallana gigas TaxID=29159 RepID=K1Q897_MAGGI